MGCCEVKGSYDDSKEPEINIIKEESFDELDLSSDEIRATTNPNKESWIMTTPLLVSRNRSTSYSHSNRIECAFLIGSPPFTKGCEVTKSVLVPYSEASLDLGVIKEEEKDITLSFEDIKNT